MHTLIPCKAHPQRPVTRRSILASKSRLYCSSTALGPSLMLRRRRQKWNFSAVTSPSLSIDNPPIRSRSETTVSDASPSCITAATALASRLAEWFPYEAWLETGVAHRARTVAKRRPSGANRLQGQSSSILEEFSAATLEGSTAADLGVNAFASTDVADKVTRTAKKATARFTQQAPDRFPAYVTDGISTSTGASSSRSSTQQTSTVSVPGTFFLRGRDDAQDHFGLGNEPPGTREILGLEPTTTACLASEFRRNNSPDEDFDRITVGQRTGPRASNTVFYDAIGPEDIFSDTSDPCCLPCFLALPAVSLTTTTGSMNRQRETGCPAAKSHSPKKETLQPSCGVRPSWQCISPSGLSSLSPTVYVTQPWHGWTRTTNQGPALVDAGSENVHPRACGQPGMGSEDAGLNLKATLAGSSTADRETIWANNVRRLHQRVCQMQQRAVLKWHGALHRLPFSSNQSVDRLQAQDNYRRSSVSATAAKTEAAFSAASASVLSDLPLQDATTAAVSNDNTASALSVERSSVRRNSTLLTDWYDRISAPLPTTSPTESCLLSQGAHESSHSRALSADALSLGSLLDSLGRGRSRTRDSGRQLAAEITSPSGTSSEHPIMTYQQHIRGLSTNRLPRCVTIGAEASAVTQYSPAACQSWSNGNACDNRLALQVRSSTLTCPSLATNGCFDQPHKQRSPQACDSLVNVASMWGSSVVNYEVGIRATSKIMSSKKCLSGRAAGAVATSRSAYVSTGDPSRLLGACDAYGEPDRRNSGDRDMQIQRPNACSQNNAPVSTLAESAKPTSPATYCGDTPVQSCTKWEYRSCSIPGFSATKPESAKSSRCTSLTRRIALANPTACTAASQPTGSLFRSARLSMRPDADSQPASSRDQLESDLHRGHQAKQAQFTASSVSWGGTSWSCLHDTQARVCFATTGETSSDSLTCGFLHAPAGQFPSSLTEGRHPPRRRPRYGISSIFLAEASPCGFHHHRERFRSCPPSATVTMSEDTIKRRAWGLLSSLTGGRLDASGGQDNSQLSARVQSIIESVDHLSPSVRTSTDSETGSGGSTISELEGLGVTSPVPGVGVNRAEVAFHPPVSLVASVAQTIPFSTYEGVPDFPTQNLKYLTSSFQLKNVTLDEVIQAYCLDDAFMKNLLGDPAEINELKLGAWSTPVCTLAEVAGAQGHKITRTSTWVKTIPSNPLAGLLKLPKSSLTTDLAELLVHPNLNAAVLQSVVMLHDFPWKFKFHVRIRFTAVQRGNAVQMDPEMEMEWLQKSWLAGKVEGGCVAEWTADVVHRRDKFFAWMQKRSAARSPGAIPSPSSPSRVTVSGESSGRNSRHSTTGQDTAGAEREAEQLLPELTTTIDTPQKLLRKISSPELKQLLGRVGSEWINRIALLIIIALLWNITRQLRENEKQLDLLTRRILENSRYETLYAPET